MRAQNTIENANPYPFVKMKKKSNFDDSSLSRKIWIEKMQHEKREKKRILHMQRSEIEMR